MSITTVTIYETDDGRQHKTFEAAQHWERRLEAHAVIEGCHDLTRDEAAAVCEFFDAIDLDQFGRHAGLASYLRGLADKLEPLKVERAE